MRIAALLFLGFIFLMIAINAPLVALVLFIIFVLPMLIAYIAFAGGGAAALCIVGILVLLCFSAFPWATFLVLGVAVTIFAVADAS